MNLAVQKFEDVMINHGGNIIIDYFKILGIVLSICIVIDYVRKRYKEKPMFFVKNILWAFIIVGKFVFCSFAFAIIFFVDFETGTYNIHNISHLPQMSFSTFLVGALAAVEMISVVESILNKFINRE